MLAYYSIACAKAFIRIKCQEKRDELSANHHLSVADEIMNIFIVTQIETERERATHSSILAPHFYILSSMNLVILCVHLYENCYLFHKCVAYMAC